MELFNSSILQEHYRSPRNAGCIKDADGRGRAADPVSGHIIDIYLRVEAGRITEAKFKAFGSPAVIAVSSLLTETVRGRKIKQAVELSSRIMGDLMAGLPPELLRCVMLAEDAFSNAVEDYFRRAEKKRAATG